MGLLWWVCYAKRGFEDKHQGDPRRVRRLDTGNQNRWAPAIRIPVTTYGRMGG